MEKIAEKFQLKEILQNNWTSTPQICHGHQKQERFEKLSQLRGA